jgi:archaeal type IV pilus assembly protein PilA
LADVQIFDRKLDGNSIRLLFPIQNVKLTMNFEKVQRKNRKAISPVLATVILIAITLIAAIAIAGFVFGLFGSFTSSAQVSAQVTKCTFNGTNDVCTVNLTNTGTSNVAVVGCSINVGGSSTVGAAAFVAPSTSLTVGASGTDLVSCTAGTTVQTVGSEAVGSFSMSNGASVPFSGVWS